MQKIARKKIVVIGSSNTDMVIRTRKFPLPGETILGGDFFIFPGGKGGNQAVAAARLGGSVTLIAKVGNDIFGNQALENFRKEGINTDFISHDAKNPSGVALITVDQNGENTIVVAQGSNKTLTSQDLGQAEKEFNDMEILLMQLEIPTDTVAAAAAKAFALGKKVILNPAPATPLPESIFKNLFLITPNESEAEALTGISVIDSTLEDVARSLVNKGVQNVLITLGQNGAYLYAGNRGRRIPSPLVKAIDTTAAGDVFNGAIAVALAENRTLEEAVEFANQCAAISVTRMGAQSSAPYRNEITSTISDKI